MTAIDALHVVAGAPLVVIILSPEIIDRVKHETLRTSIILSLMHGGVDFATSTGRVYIIWALVHRDIFSVEDVPVVVRDVVVPSPMRWSHSDSFEVLEILAGQVVRGVANRAVASVGIHDCREEETPAIGAFSSTVILFFGIMLWETASGANLTSTLTHEITAIHLLNQQASWATVVAVVLIWGFRGGRYGTAAGGNPK